MSHVIKFVVAALALGVGAAIVYQVATKRPDQGAAPPAVPEPGTPPDLVAPDLVAELDRATDLDAPSLFRQALEREATDAARTALRRRFDARGEAVVGRVRARVDEQLGGLRYKTAVAFIEKYRRSWGGTPAHAALGELLAELRTEQEEQLKTRFDEARQLFDAGRHLAARESLATDLEFEDRYRTMLEDYSIQLERRMRSGERAPPPPTAGASKPPTVAAVPSPPPPLPGFPHPDVKRRREARALLARAQKSINGRRYREAAELLKELTGFYGDLQLVDGRRPAIGALYALARRSAKGLSGLFNATHVRRSGGRISLHYTFASKDEYLDWEEMATFPHKDKGSFKPTTNGVRGDGVQGYLLRAFFLNDVRIHCVAKPNKAKTHGLLFCQHGNEQRQLMWVVTNHWFVEGENYRLERPGHSLLMFGKGVNNDVPVDSPEIGFVFRLPNIEKPSPPAGATIGLRFRLHGKKMTGEIEYKGVVGKRTDSTIGDDGRGIDRTRPGLVVVENSVVFREIKIDGRIHPTFEETRVRELLDLAALLDAD